MYGYRLRMLRNEKRKTLREMADDLHLTYSTIGMIERDEHNMTSDQVKMFSEYFGVSTDYLLGKSDERNPMPKQTISLDPAFVDFAFYNQRGIVTEDQRKEIENFIAFVKSKEGK